MVVAAALALSSIATGGWAQTPASTPAQDYPVKPIRIIAPYAPGGGTDLLSRFIARKLNEAWGQQVLVENRLGAGGIIGTELVARAPADGYTLLMTASTHAINPSLFRKLPYDPIKDFAPIGMVATGPNILVVHPSVPVKSVKELIALARKRPGELTFASAGIGSTTHLAGEFFKSVAGIDVVHVPYKGSGLAQVDLIGGHVDFMVDSLPSGLPNAKAGRTRALATTGNKRFPTMPYVPTALEAGLAGYESISWWGLLAPQGTPPALVIKLNTEVNRILRQPDVQEFVLNLGAEPKPGTPEAFMDYIRVETGLYSKVIQKAGIKAE
ncbi:MAG: tripartite tricarboxylate transporter substrate binding protein [Proteobacteria bacterium]|nr:tripartite tricarboxylate transporter substrate binding protein [Burkholderiales bacterium]